uniref:Uncharacterized protein n=1 Tax=Tanacetum cinerariifolium TaxID=118510 RepID=A0A6L2P5T3_TANCI|nr:hypothetical protein [Tanacetum cinerariifolium]
MFVLEFKDRGSKVWDGVELGRLWAVWPGGVVLRLLIVEECEVNSRESDVSRKVLEGDEEGVIDQYENWVSSKVTCLEMMILLVSSLSQRKP